MLPIEVVVKRLDTRAEAVAAAAHTAPVGAYCSALTVISERTTSSRHSPAYVQRSIHSSQY